MTLIKIVGGSIIDRKLTDSITILLCGLINFVHINIFLSI
jgi:hypothetical protein